MAIRFYINSMIHLFIYLYTYLYKMTMVIKISATRTLKVFFFFVVVFALFVYSFLITTTTTSTTTTLIITEKIMEHESDGDANCNWRTQWRHQRIGTGTRELGNNWTRGDHPNYYIIETGQNTEKSPKDLRRLVVTQTPVKDHQLMLG